MIGDTVRFPGLPDARIVYEELVETVGVREDGTVYRYRYTAVRTRQNDKAIPKAIE